MVEVAFIGLGVMGFPMARHLMAKGHAVTVYNRTGAKTERWVTENGGRGAETPAAAARGAAMVFACVGNDDDLRAVTTGADGAFAGMATGTIFVDHTTASAAVARELHAVALERGIGFLDAPVSGGQSGAENGAADGDGGRRAEAVRAGRAGDLRAMRGRYGCWAGPGRGNSPR